MPAFTFVAIHISAWIAVLYIEKDAAMGTHNPKAIPGNLVCALKATLIFAAAFATAGLQTDEQIPADFVRFSGMFALVQAVSAAANGKPMS